MEIIKLDQSHKDLFEEFKSEGIDKKKIQSDHLWSNIEFISPTRQIFAIVENNQIQQTIASNLFPSMPWSKTDTQLTRKGLSFYQTKDNTSKLMDVFLNNCEKDGIWGHWYIRDSRIDRVMFRRANIDFQGTKVSKFGAPVAEVFNKNYNWTQAAIVKAGNLTGNKTYDWMLGFKPLTYDVRICFALAKHDYITSTMKESITYG